jgi:hypothetical protein
MPAFRTGAVTEILLERSGLQRVLVDFGEGEARAYVLTQVTPSVHVGDRVVVNTTAVELGLGTGGWHVVHWNLSVEEWRSPGPGHLMKARYLSVQADVGAAEEHHPELADVARIDGVPVVALPLHSQLAAVAVAFKDRAPGARLVYVMTDGASLPIAISDLVFELRERELVDATVTSGQAFGGDYEAISLPSALAVARVIAKADAIVVSAGPGSAGTATRLGFSGIEMGGVIDAAAGVGAVPIAALRYSVADPRDRHRGISHHTLTALTTGTRSRALVALPAGLDADVAVLRDRHEFVTVPTTGIVDAMAAYGVHAESMGRPAAIDPLLFECAAVAGIVAAEHVT